MSQDKRWVRPNGSYYSGDQQDLEDREAAQEELLDRSKAEWRNQANLDFTNRKSLYLNNIAYADAMGRDSGALKAALQKEEDDFKARILLINQEINPYAAE